MISGWLLNCRVSGAGFIGSNLIARLNFEGERDIIVVDNLEKSAKFKNLIDLQIQDYVPKAMLFDWLHDRGQSVSVIFHQGACTNTLEYDGDYMMSNNFEYSKKLFQFAISQQIPFIYASSAAVYGHSFSTGELPVNEVPLNIYGYSKLLFDRYVRLNTPSVSSTVVGLRHFNVYGNREFHKDKMSSMVTQIHNQILKTGIASLFGECGGFGAGEQKRDFVFVEDIVDLILFFWAFSPSASGG